MKVKIKSNIPVSDTQMTGLSPDGGSRPKIIISTLNNTP